MEHRASRRYGCFLDDLQGGKRQTAYAIKDVGWLAQKEEWAGLKSIVAVRREVEIKKSGEDFLRHIRMEWTVETMH